MSGPWFHRFRMIYHQKKTFRCFKYDHSICLWICVDWWYSTFVQQSWKFNPLYLYVFVRYIMGSFKNILSPVEKKIYPLFFIQWWCRGYSLPVIIFNDCFENIPKKDILSKVTLFYKGLKLFCEQNYLNWKCKFFAFRHTIRRSTWKILASTLSRADIGNNLQLFAIYTNRFHL